MNLTLEQHLGEIATWLEMGAPESFAKVTTLDMLEALNFFQSKIIKKAEAFENIRKLCGYVEDGSGTTVRIFQDDATKDWFLRIGSDLFRSPTYYGGSLISAIDNAMKEREE